MTKAYVLVLICLYTRTINFKLLKELSLTEFLRFLHIHVHEYGLPQFVLSDLGTQWIAGASIITNILSEPETITHLKNNNSSAINFQQYYKGRHELGSLVETRAKISKRLILGTIKNNVISLREFEFMVSRTVYLVNRRPIGVRESLRDSDTSIFFYEYFTAFSF